MRFRLLWPLAAFFLLSFARKPVVTVQFFAEANARDTSTFSVPVNLEFPPRQASVEKIPFLTERDIIAIYPFVAGDGTFGCAFKFNEHGRFDLEMTSTDRRGSSLVVVVNNRQVIDMLIDKRVDDGIITVPNRMTPAEITALQKKFPVLGQTKKRR